MKEFPILPIERVLIDNTWPTFEKGLAPLLPAQMYIGYELGPVAFTSFVNYCGEILNRTGRNNVGVILTFSRDHEEAVKMKVVDVNDVEGVPFDALTSEDIDHGLDVYQDAAFINPDNCIVTCILSRDGDFIFMSDEAYKPSLTTQ